MITTQDRNAIRKIFQKIKTASDPRVAKLVAGTDAHPEAGKVNAADLAMKVCLEVVLSESQPYGVQFCTDLAVRLSAYMLSLAPEEMHPVLVEAVNATLKEMLEIQVRQNKEAEMRRQLKPPVSVPAIKPSKSEMH